MEYIELDTTPTAEDCVQVDRSGEYLPAMTAEARRFVALLRTVFAEFPRVRFGIRRESHDFGPYLQVTINYDDNDQEAARDAYFIEEHIPERWTDTQPIPNPYAGQPRWTDLPSFP